MCGWRCALTLALSRCGAGEGTGRGCQAGVASFSMALANSVRALAGTIIITPTPVSVLYLDVAMPWSTTQSVSISPVRSRLHLSVKDGSEGAN